MFCLKFFLIFLGFLVLGAGASRFVTLPLSVVSSGVSVFSGGLMGRNVECFFWNEILEFFDRCVE